MERIARDTYDGNLKPGQLDESHILNTYQEINKATGTGYGKNWLKVEGATGAPAPEALKMQQNIFRFSGAKDAAMLQEINGLLTKDGKLANWQDFKSAVLTLNNKYNINYLQAEWQTAKHAGYMANLWQEYLANTTLFPNLKYKTQQDGRVRREHENLNNTIAPIDSAFWEKYYPPNGWRCRCYTVQTAEDATKELPTILPTDVKPEFLINVGKTGQVFKEGKEDGGKPHPYFMLLKQQPNIERKINRFIYNSLLFQAEKKLITKTIDHNSIKAIGFNNVGIKEAFNQPHRNFQDKIWLISYMDTIIPQSEYLGFKVNPIYNPMIKGAHIFRIYINGEPSYIIVRETASGEKFFYSISDRPKVAEGAKI